MAETCYKQQIKSDPLILDLGNKAFVDLSSDNLLETLQKLPCLPFAVIKDGNGKCERGRFTIGGQSLIATNKFIEMIKNPQFNLLTIDSDILIRFLICVTAIKNVMTSPISEGNKFLKPDLRKVDVKQKIRIDDSFSFETFRIDGKGIIEFKKQPLKPIDVGDKVVVRIDDFDPKDKRLIVQDLKEVNLSETAGHGTLTYTDRILRKEEIGFGWIQPAFVENGNIYIDPDTGRVTGFNPNPKEKADHMHIDDVRVLFKAFEVLQSQAKSLRPKADQEKKLINFKNLSQEEIDSAFLNEYSSIINACGPLLRGVSRDAIKSKIKDHIFEVDGIARKMTEQEAGWIFYWLNNLTLEDYGNV